MTYKNLSVEDKTFDRFHASKTKYGEKVGVTGTVTEFLDLVITGWDDLQQKEAEAQK